MDYKTAKALADQYVERAKTFSESFIYRDADGGGKQYIRRALIADGYQLIALFVNNGNCPSHTQANRAMNKIAQVIGQLIEIDPEV